jgi:hypothetical protein
MSSKKAAVVQTFLHNINITQFCRHLVDGELFSPYDFRKTRPTTVYMTNYFTLFIYQVTYLFVRNMSNFMSSCPLSYYCLKHFFLNISFGLFAIYLQYAV